MPGSERSLLADVQSPKRQSYSNHDRAPTVMSCAVPCEQDHGPVDGEGDRHCSLDCSECLKRRIRLHGPPGGCACDSKTKNAARVVGWGTAAIQSKLGEAIPQSSTAQVSGPGSRVRLTVANASSAL
jgi:hypothetical protein